MSTIFIKVDVSQLDNEDRAAIRHICDLENKRRQDAAAEPLDVSTGQMRKEYYEYLMVEAVKELHKRNIALTLRRADQQKEFQELRSAWVDATPEQRAAALKAMTTPVTG